MRMILYAGHEEREPSREGDLPENFGIRDPRLPEEEKNPARGKIKQRKRTMSIYGITTIPLEAQSLYRRGIELSNQENHEAAAKCLRQAIIISPRFAAAYRELGHCLIRLDRKSDAEDCFRKSFPSAPPEKNQRGSDTPFPVAHR